MSNRPTATYGLAQMLASDPEIGTRLKAWMDANPDAMDRRKQRKLLRDLEAAEALLHAQAVESAASEVGSGFRGPGQEVPRDGDEAIDDETACDAEADGSVVLEREVVFGQARTYGEGAEAAVDEDRAVVRVKPMHSHAWVLWCAVMAWFDAVSRFAAMAVIGMAVALVADFRAVWAWIGERDKSRPRKRFLLATALRPSCIWGVLGRFVAAEGVRSWMLNLSARGPPRWTLLRM